MTVNVGTLTVEGAANVLENFTWNGGEMDGFGTTTLGPEVEGTIDGGPDYMNNRTLVIDNRLTWSNGGLLSEEGARIINNGYLNMTSSNLSFTGLEGYGELNNEGTIENDESTVHIEWETTGPLPRQLECVVCFILDPEADPPEGICSIAASGGFVFFPLPTSPVPFPPSYETFTRNWECTAGEGRAARAGANLSARPPTEALGQL
jgi:hypothetical protein